MTRLNERDRFVFTIVAIVASVFLFACGTGQETGSGETFAERVKARRGHGTPETASMAERRDTASSAGAAAPGAAVPSGAAQPLPAQAQPQGEPAESVQPAGDTSLRQADVIPSVQMVPEPAQESTSSQPVRPAPVLRDSTGARVFSNRDLERYRRTKEDFGFRDGVVKVDVTKKPADATKGADEVASSEKLTRAEHEAELSATQSKINVAMQELDYLKKRLLPLENPFVARPTLSEEDKLAESGMDNKERLQRVKERIAQLEGELGGLQRHFAELQSTKPSDTSEEAADAGTPDRE